MLKAKIFTVKSVQNRAGYFAELLHKSMQGMGTKDQDLMRILISRAEVDLAQIKVEYKAMFGKSLYDAVRSDLSGDYEVDIYSTFFFLLLYIIFIYTLFRNFS